MFSDNNINKWWIVEWLLNTDWYLQTKKWWVWSDWYNRKWQVSIEYCSISKELIKWLHILLNDLWVINYYKKRIKKIRLKTLNTDAYESYCLCISDIDSLKKILNNCDISLKKNYEKFYNGVINNIWYTNSNIWTIPLCSIKEKKYKSNDWWKTINGIRYPRYNYQRNKTKN
jgi:hypothetical protein